jgi:hypothetical protein
VRRRADQSGREAAAQAAAARAAQAEAAALSSDVERWRDECGRLEAELATCHRK